ncbi:hypothetical protein MKX07_007198 [Trichoderma sp. CBMAI-0711]|uniref:SSCRP protein n=1 Tax=Trichoderma parareesei TaxID=858221 RepID=A0A2H2Z3U8_TRIPA|nr:hypothetical protein MKX07_007198 [Trichoderma sp. CBMAI-0711]OTA02399.1 hypothetical protein A9Z42_0027620 [Trichoderma parareesei]
MARIHLLVLLLAALVALASASSAPRFCKCTCFKNSTIIPLGPQHQSDQRSLFHDDHHDARRTASTSCADCTKAFCLSQGISFCENADEDDVVTMCFQRDSNKDKIIVWGFIFGTLGLLGWAAFKRVLEWREARNLGRLGASYAAVGGTR